MGVQSEIGKTLGVAAAAASIAKGFSLAKEKEAKAEELEAIKSEREAEEESKKKFKEAKAKKENELKEAEAAKEKAIKEQKAKDLEKKRQEKEEETSFRENVTQLQVNENAIKQNNSEIARLNQKISDFDKENGKTIKDTQARIKRLNNLKNKGGNARMEAEAFLEDLMGQKRTLTNARERRLQLNKVKQAQQKELAEKVAARVPSFSAAPYGGEKDGEE